MPSDVVVIKVQVSSVVDVWWIEEREYLPGQAGQRLLRERKPILMRRRWKEGTWLTV